MKRDDKQQMLSAFGLVGSVGIQMVVSAAIGLAAGRWLDGFAGSSPWGTVIGIFAGLVAGLWGTYKRVMGGR